MADVDHKPNLPLDEIRQWFQEHYALVGDFKPLPGERDLNFRLSAEDGDSYVCKICDSSENLALLSAQHAVMQFLNQGKLSAVPNVVRSRNGRTLVTVRAMDGQSYGVRVLTYIPGQTLIRCAPYSLELVRDFGRTMGQLAKVLVEFDHPAFHHDFHWDLAHALETVVRYRELLPDSGLREPIDRIYRDFKDIVEPRFGSLRKSVIHNDANDYNILAQGDKITGIIDFGDMVYSYTVCDLAIAMAYATLEADDILSLVTAMTAGYHNAMPLEGEELKVLLPMLRMRLAVSACIAAHQISLRPDDAYLTISQEPIRRTLPRLLALEAEAVENQLRKALP